VNFSYFLKQFSITFKWLAWPFPVHLLIKEIRYPGENVEIVVVEEALTSGDSGGPVFDKNGLVIGMVQGGIPSSSTQIGWMIPIRLVKSFRNRANGTKVLRTFSARHKLKSYLRIISRYRSISSISDRVCFPMVYPILDVATSKSFKH
jgi:hypothetical protein